MDFKDSEEGANTFFFLSMNEQDNKQSQTLKLSFYSLKQSIPQNVTEGAANFFARDVT
jgi:hypothetical protein